LFATHTAPAANDTAEGSLPVTTVATTFGTFGSILETVPALVRDPDRAGAKSQSGGALSDRNRCQRRAGTWIDLRHRPRVVTGDPNRTGSKGDGRGMDRERNG
jgi:hypothetical protein